jgi:hypothetical protein
MDLRERLNGSQIKYKLQLYGSVGDILLALLRLTGPSMIRLSNSGDNFMVRMLPDN